MQNQADHAPGFRMGVKDLWSLLDRVKQVKSLEELSGQAIAVDLSSWVIQSELKMNRIANPVKSPHLRNLFFRTACLLENGITPIFVLDGEAPSVKGKCLIKRGSSSKQRRYLREKLSECCDLLACLGVQFVWSRGEAEALCAQLNANKCVDACMTEDGDAFLYGATKVYRFSMEEKTVNAYEMKDIEKELNLNQRNLIGLALLTGCDYYDGVENVGVEKAHSLVKKLPPGTDLIQRFIEWKTESERYKTLQGYKDAKKPAHCGNCGHPGSKPIHEQNGCQVCGTEMSCLEQDSDSVCQCNWHLNHSNFKSHSLEMRLRKRAVEADGFPPQEVIDEFLKPDIGNVDKNVDWQRPKLKDMIDFGEEWLNWTSDKVIKKVLPLLIAWQMQVPRSTAVRNQAKHFVIPHRIVKERILKSVAKYEVEWNKLDEDVWTKDEYYVTLVRKDAFNQQFPEKLSEYNKLKEENVAQKAAKKRAKSPRSSAKKRKTDTVLEGQSQMKHYWTHKTRVRRNLFDVSTSESTAVNFQTKISETPEHNRPKAGHLGKEAVTLIDIGTENEIISKEKLSKSDNTSESDIKISTTMGDTPEHNGPKAGPLCKKAVTLIDIGTENEIISKEKLSKSDNTSESDIKISTTMGDTPEHNRPKAGPLGKKSSYIN
ncbi:unnamed protein product [Owenia fusiformis]|uniref:GEN1 n=1 Tax=Owenia fusiformis TaxID=6347 RepID=A0A8S4NC64_OWEFU|nr:unnamed protein product [Owenia fusiformis]